MVTYKPTCAGYYKWSQGSAGWIDITSASTSCAYTDSTTSYSAWNDDPWKVVKVEVQKEHAEPGDVITLPDGAKLIVDDQGNYHINDKDAKVIYKAHRIREFSPHLNASDMVGKFIDYVRTLGIRQEEVMGLPLELFINWLVIEAATRDDDPIPEGVKLLPEHEKVKEIVHPRCELCKRFIPRLHYRNRFPYCNPEHARSFLAKVG